MDRRAFPSILSAVAALLLLLPAAPTGAQDPFVIENGSMALSGANIPGWDGTSTMGRDNGAFNGTVTHQAIDSPSDPNPGSGSLVFEFTGAAGSLSQRIDLTGSGQTLQGFSADIAHDGSFTALVITFYEENAWDCVPGSSVDVIAEGVPADTDGTLDSFTTVTVPSFTMTSSGNPLRILIGTSTSCSGFSGHQVGSKFAIDNVRLLSTSVEEWMLY